MNELYLTVWGGCNAQGDVLAPAGDDGDPYYFRVGFPMRSDCCFDDTTGWMFEWPGNECDSDDAVLETGILWQMLGKNPSDCIGKTFRIVMSAEEVDIKRPTHRGWLTGFKRKDNEPPTEAEVTEWIKNYEPQN